MRWRLFLRWHSARRRRGKAFRANPNQALRGGASGYKPGRGWPFRELLLGAQVALCCVLVDSLFCRHARRAAGVSNACGYSAARRERGGVRFGPGAVRTKGRRGVSAPRARCRIAITRSDRRRICGFLPARSRSIQLGRASATAKPIFALRKAIRVSHYDVSPGYFGAIGTHLLAGRDFTWHDDAKAPLRAIVNRAFARQVWARKRRGAVLPRPAALTSRRCRSIGIVEDGKYQRADGRSTARGFPPDAAELQRHYLPAGARRSSPKRALALQMEQAVQGLDRGLPLYSVGALENLLDVTYFQARAAAWALSAFGVLALMLAVTGIYGLSAYTVSRRVREIGIRVAIGAQPGAGFAIGAGAHGGGSRRRRAGGHRGWHRLHDRAGPCGAASHASRPHGAGRSRDYYACGSDCLSCWAPARRAISVDPIRSLRHE